MDRRDERVISMLEGGATLASAGAAFGISRERVRQIKAKHERTLLALARDSSHAFPPHPGGDLLRYAKARDEFVGARVKSGESPSDANSRFQRLFPHFTLIGG